MYKSGHISIKNMHLHVGAVTIDIIKDIGSHITRILKKNSKNTYVILHSTALRPPKGARALQNMVARHIDSY